MGLFDFFFGKKDNIDPAPSDKRDIPRWEVSLPAKIKFEGFEDEIECEVRDLNLKGFYLVAGKQIPKEQAVAWLRFNQGPSFKIEMLILWEKEADGKYLYGVKFTKLSGPDRENICQVMKDYFSANIWWKDSGDIDNKRS